jgi:ribosomal protein S18 acetylase RimI-like enzyme
VEIKVQPLHQRNIDDVLRLQKTAYAADFLEDADSFLAKIVASPSTSFGAWRGDAMVGYLIALPLMIDEGLDLNTSNVPTVPISEARVMYIHDLAVQPEARSLGVADHLLQRLEDEVRGSVISQWHLVSVQGSQGFWEKRGFEVSPDPPPNGYGPEAVLMLRL